ncbi:MAG: hypothetical protein R6W82_05895 [bacterium]
MIPSTASPASGRIPALGSPLLLLLLLLLSLSLPVSIPGRTAAQSGGPERVWTLDYVLRPAFEGRSMEVTAVLRGDISGGVLWHTGRRMEAQVERSRPEARDGFGQPLRAASVDRGWIITGGSGEGMRVSYTLSSSEELPRGADGVGFGSEVLYGPGEAIFLIPASADSDDPDRPPLRMGEIEVVFDIPVSWRIVVPWEGYGRRYRPRDTGELWEAIVAVGDLRRRIVEIAGIEVTIGIQGRRPSMDTLVMEAVRRVLRTGQEVYGAPASPRMTVVLPEVRRGGARVLRLGRSLGMDWNDGPGASAGTGMLHQMTRELLFMWRGIEPSEPAWYAEGVTDYLAWLVLLRQNLVDGEEFSRRLLASERIYLDHPHHEGWSLVEEEARMDREELGMPSSLARSRGSVVALALDATLARLSGGRSRLTDLLGKVHRSRMTGPEGPAPIQNADIMRACSTLTGGDYLVEFFTTLVFGPGRPPTAEALADVLNREGAGD